MKDSLTIRRALVSVDDKSCLGTVVQALADRDVEIIASGGTAQAIQELGIPVTEIAEITGMKESFDGRIKTIHPSIYAALLARRDRPDHCQALIELGIDPIDLVIVIPYNFTEAVKNDSIDLIERIDIGGISLLRAAAKAYESVVTLGSIEDYQNFLAEFIQDGRISYEFRQHMAMRIFALTAAYDAQIANWFSCHKDSNRLAQQAQALPEVIFVGGQQLGQLRYGENPHQSAAIYGCLSDSKTYLEPFLSLRNRLSINNIRDSLAAISLVYEFNCPAAVIIKHGNPCGISCSESLIQAWEKAYACDPQSAFGGVVAFNHTLDIKTVKALGTLKIDIVITPAISPEAKDLFEQKRKTTRLLVISQPISSNLCCFPIGQNLLVQAHDSLSVDRESLRIVSKRIPSEREMQDMLFAFTIAKHTASNAIVLARDKMAIGIGSGQTSRIDAMKIALDKEASHRHLHDMHSHASTDRVAASDGFFPFPDSVLLAAQKGITAIIQPGGSVKDHEIITTANDHNLGMIFTGIRHFRH